MLVVMTDRFKIVTICARNVPVYTDRSAWTTMPLVDTSINDRLDKLHLFHQTCFEFMWIIVVSYSEGSVEFYLYPTVSTALIHSVKPELIK